MESGREGVIPLKNNKELEKLAESLRQAIDINYWKDKCNNLQSKIDKFIELLEELKYNQNINLSQGLENRVDIDYIIERLTDCLGDDE